MWTDEQVDMLEAKLKRMKKWEFDQLIGELNAVLIAAGWYKF